MNIWKCYYSTSSPDGISYCNMTMERCPIEAWVEQQPQVKCQCGVVLLDPLTNKVIRRLLGQETEFPWEEHQKVIKDWQDLHLDQLGKERFEEWLKEDHIEEFIDYVQRRLRDDVAQDL